MTQQEREEGAGHNLLTVRFITYQHHSLRYPIIAPFTHAFWSQVIDFFYGSCINDTNNNFGSFWFSMVLVGHCFINCMASESFVVSFS